LLELVLASEANMHPELKTDEKKRAECLGKALAEAIEMCGFYEYEYNRKLVSDGDPEVVQALLSPPAHWGPVSPDVLAEGVRAATRVVGGDEVAGEFTVIIKLLSKAGADLDVDGGALLRAAAKLGESHIKVLESVITGGADIRRYGAAALRDATPEAALVLLEAGVPVTSDPAVRRQLLWVVLEYQVYGRAGELESALGSLKRTKVSGEYVHGVVSAAP
jgi:hypothetical protein